MGEINSVSKVSIVDEWLKLKLSLAFMQPAILWRAPVETVSQSEGGFQLVYQSSDGYADLAYFASTSLVVGKQKSA